MMPLPVLRLELEGMKAAILRSFTEYTVQMDLDIRDAIERVCRPENLKRIVNEEVAKAVNEIVRSEVSSFYNYGEGAGSIRRLVGEILSGGLPRVERMEE
jgi:hypothetical protein